MPFTPSHVAAVLPMLGRGGLVPAALVIGSMAPDLPYYLQLGTESKLTHSALGLVTVDLVMALVVFAAWQALVAPALHAVAPPRVRSRVPLPSALTSHVASPRALGLLLASLLIGGATHVIWDAFTHVDRWGTDAIPWLTEQHGRLQGYRWAQYASSLGGLLIIAAFVAWWWRARSAPRAADGAPATVSASRADHGPAAPRAVTIAFVSAVALALTAGAAAGMLTAIVGDVGLRRGVFRALVWGGGAGMLGLLLASTAVRIGLARDRRGAETPPTS